ncbi:hypothetical protein JYT89_01645 [Flavobacteriaceae bacterium AH-315-B10]|nr:hypothetical protein [Flavobacteriaceae bacterium AH-315-B10]
MDDFNTIRLKKNTIEKFREYSKKVSPNYSETLDFMIAFFEDNDLSPYDTINSPMVSFTNTINKRIDAVASILKNIEKTQLIPSRELLESLFEEVEEIEKQPRLIERTAKEIEESKSEEEKLLDYYSEQYDVTKRELFKLKEDFRIVLNKLIYIRNTFGANYYRLDITKEEFEKLKLK